MPNAHYFVERDSDEIELVPFLDGEAAVFSSRSPDRESEPNEDAAGLIPYDDRSGLIVVADGAGGTRAGGDAARIVVERLAAAVAAGAKEAIPLRSTVLNGIEQANREIVALGTGAATTVVVAQIAGDDVRPYHVGDSIVLVVGQRGKVKHQNVPHGPVGYAIEAGLIDEREAMLHEERHLVSNFVGRDDMRIEIGPRFRRGARDSVLVASDGVSDNLFPREIVERIRKGPLAKAAASLAASCRRRMSSGPGTAPGKPDDLTFVLYRKAHARRRTRRAAEAREGAAV